MFLDETSFNLTCLPSGSWSGDLVACINITCPPVVFDKQTVDQLVLDNPTDNIAGYTTSFTLECGFREEQFDFGELEEPVTTVDYYCNRRYIL